ncbi:MAG: hypothetical protein JSS02_06255, partial [Planctomycetes bacterium]|nr:hypothetical protein [Planctomycetota bacterium]
MALSAKIVLCPRVRDLEDSADDESVVNFLLTVARDDAEFDLARIEALKIFEIHEYQDQGIRYRIANTLSAVLAYSQDLQVRNFTAMAAASYINNEELASVIGRILHDSNEASDLRWNAFAAITKSKISAWSTDMLRGLLDD